MTDLERLKAAYDAADVAYTAADVAYTAALDAAYAARNAARGAALNARDASDAARDAFNDAYNAARNASKAYEAALAAQTKGQTMTEIERLKATLAPCPFCGDRGPEITRIRGNYFIACTSGTDCMVRGPECQTEAEAIAAWNTRADPALAAAQAEIARLRAAISWLEPPFIDDKTSEAELRSRIGFCLADAARAALVQP